MKVARFSWRGQATWGIVVGDALHALEGELWADMRPGRELCSFEEARLLAPVEPHNKVIGLGLTFRDMYARYEETHGKQRRDGPAIFMKPPTTNIGHMEPIVYPRICTRVIHEAEVGIVM